MDNLAKDLVQKFELLKGRRANWDAHWKEASDYVLPDNNNVYGVYSPGEKKGIKVFDNTPTHANELLASALHGMLTNPASYWFWLRTGVKEIDEQDDVRKWLQHAAIKMHEVMNASNFQTEIHEVYQGLGAVGTWTLLIDEDDDSIVRFLARPIYSSYIQENYKGLVDSLYREFKLNFREVKQQFENKENEEEIKKLSRQYKDDDEVTLIHCVFPREDFDNTSVPKRFKYASVYVCKVPELLLSESGYREFPYAVPRWSKMSGEIYGRSPAMKCLADIKMLNKIMLTQIKGLEKTVDPPLLVQDDGIIFPLKLIPGGLNFYRAGMERPIMPLQTDARVDYGQKALEDLRSRIRQSFFIDQLKLHEGPQMTATEVNERIEEMLRLMGPILGRLHHELLKPTIDRVFNIMLRRGALPAPIPMALSKSKLQIKYSSQIAKAQRTSEANNFTRVMGIIAPIAQVQPEIMERINGDGVIKYVTGIYDIPEEVLRTDKELKQIHDMRAMQAEQQAKMQQQMQAAEMVQKAGPTAMMAQDKMEQESPEGMME